MHVGFVPDTWEEAFEQLAAVRFISPTWRGLITRDQMCQLLRQAGGQAGGAWDAAAALRATAAAFGTHVTAKSALRETISLMQE